MNKADSNSQPPARRRRQFWFRCAAVVLGLLPFVLLELALRLLGVASPANQRDPLAGFNQQQTLFERAGGVYRARHSREPFFGPQEFAASKPANGYRVFCFGGSTVFGHPYTADTAFPKWLELELAARQPARRVEVVNCGGVSYASYRLAPIVREVLGYQPDLIVLAMGQNEFLEDRTYQAEKQRSGLRRWLEDRALSLRTVLLLRRWFHRGEPSAASAAENFSAAPPLSPEVNARLDDARTGYGSYHRDDAWRQQVVRQFEDTFRGMIEACRAAGVPVLVVTLGTNLRDCPPFKAEHRPGLTPEQELQWQVLFDAATEMEKSNPSSALELYRKAATIDGEHALLAWRTARVLDRLGEAGQAKEFYQRAKETDVCPLRMIEPVFQIQHRLAAETKTPLVNARELIAARCAEGIPGSELYVDHVHPAIGGHQFIAAAIAAKLDETRLFPLAASWSAEARRAAYRRHFAQLPATYFPNGRRRVEWLENWARRQKLAAETLPADARGFLRQGIRSLDFGDEQAAWGSFMTALRQEPATAKDLLRHVEELLEQGRPAAAQSLLTGLKSAVTDSRWKEEMERIAARVVSDLNAR